MDRFPLISIILPNYNHGAFLPQRLQSIYAQTYQNIEVIILDDNSQDNSINLLKEYQNHPKTSHFIINKKNSGSPFKQWKKGIKLAKGKYIWIAESDDWANLDFLEKLVTTLEEDDSLALAYTQSKKVNSSGELVDDMLNYTYQFKPNKWQAAYINEGNNEIKDYLIYKNTIPNASAVVFRNKTGITRFLKTDMKMVGDWWFWVHIIKDRKIAFVPERLNFFRNHAHSTRVNLSLTEKLNNITERMTVLAAIQNFFPLKKEELKKIKQTLISELILWVYPNEYLRTSKFIKANFNNTSAFSTLLLKAYIQWIANKFIAIKRRIKPTPALLISEKSPSQSVKKLVNSVISDTTSSFK